jgi:glycosyltransferase involved in cell wall biosynthesis
MNNMMFTLCRYLRDRNIPTYLFLFNDEATHFLPEADSYSDSYKAYTTVLPFGKSNLYEPGIKNKLAVIFKEFDFFIGTDVAPALLALLGKRINIFIPHGSDIYEYPFPSPPEKNVSKVWWSREKYYTGLIQKLAINNAGLILFPNEYDLNFPFKHKLDCADKFYDSTGPMLYVPQYDQSLFYTEREKLHHYPFFKQVREKYDVVVFSHVRQNGYELSEDRKIYEKGNEFVIQAFAKFLEKKRNSCLILFEYGMDIDSAKRLIKQLGIEEHVIWMPKMQRKEIMAGLMMADICCGEFKNSWLTCGVVNECLAIGKPLIHYRNDELYKNNYKDLYPVLNASDANGIEKQLHYFYENKSKVIEESKAGVKWIEEYTVVKPLTIILEHIEKSKGTVNELPFIQKIKRDWINVKFQVLSNWYRLLSKVSL